MTGAKERPILRLTDVSKSFGGLVAVNKLSFEVSDGMILGLIGPNGAGKTTVFNLISGISPSTSGCVEFRGEDITQWRSYQIAKAGMARTFQEIHPNEFKSTWVGNKAIYRTRMAMADDGDLYVIAPGLRHFGEDKVFDQIIRKFGYIGTPRILELVQTEADLRNNLSAAAHLIHGSSEGRFRITYAPGYLSKEEIEGVNFNYLPMEVAQELFDYTKLRDGFNRLKNGEEVFFISNPALGLWALKENFRR